MCKSVVLCFFFKQKTAYEMRISDWSSDVCSSDLLFQRAGEAIGHAGRQILLLTADIDERARRVRQRGKPVFEGRQVLKDRELIPVERRAADDKGVESPRPRQQRVQIGRESWRERVWQYV